MIIKSSLSLGIGICVLTSIMIIALLAYANVLYKRQLKDRTLADEPIELTETRKKLRASHADKVSQIPVILKEMWLLVDSVVNEKKKSTVSEEQLQDVLIRLARKGNTKYQVNTMMDKRHIGLMLKKNQDYIALLAKLKEVGLPISAKAISDKIDLFLKNVSEAYSINLLKSYYETNYPSALLPQGMKDKLDQSSEAFERGIRSNFIQIEKALEDYLSGKEFND